MKRMKLNAISATVVAVLALSLAGCSTPIMTRVSGMGAGVAPPARLSIIAAEEDGPAIDGETQAALAAALTKQGYAVESDGDYILDFSFADRPATIGVSVGQADTLSGAKAKKPLQSCKERTHRLTLLIVERKTGQPVYRSGAEEHHCKGTLAESRNALINAVVSDIKQPVPEHLIPRNGRK
jgi:hypothetical protein